MAAKRPPFPQVSRERIGATKQLNAIMANAAKLEKEWNLLGPEEISALKAATDIRLRLLAKCLPDLKAIDLTGDLTISGELTIDLK